TWPNTTAVAHADSAHSEHLERPEGPWKPSPTPDSPAVAHGPATASGSGRWPASTPAAPPTLAAQVSASAQPPQTPTRAPLVRASSRPGRLRPGHRRRSPGPPPGHTPVLIHPAGPGTPTTRPRASTIRPR